MSATNVETLSPTELQHEIEQFLYREAELLDDRRFADWVDLFSDDCFYRMKTTTPSCVTWTTTNWACAED
jgi:3-phenylpropionate/cinnamic acid dioxygenase small subunit